MKSQNSYTMIFLIALVVIQQANTQFSARPIQPGATKLGPQDIKINNGQSGEIFLHEIPTEDLPMAREYGFSFWIRATYATPVPQNWGLIHGAWGGIGGMTENAQQIYPGVALGDRALVMWHANGAHGPAQGIPAFHCSSYQMNNGNPWKDLKYTEREDFDYSWVFVHASYSYETSQAFIWAYFSGSNTVNHQSWENNNKRWPLTKLTFRLGPSHNGEQASVNSHYKNIEIFYGQQQMNILVNNQEKFLDIKNAKNFDLSRNKVNHKIFNIVGRSPYERLVSNNELRAESFENLDGVEEYSVYGWARWNYTPHKRAWHILYRLSPYRLAEIGNAEKPGDRELVCWVGAGFFHFSSSTFNYYGGHNNNLWKNIEYGDNLRGEGQQLWENVWHMKPDYMTLLLGKDAQHGSFNGEYKYVNVHFGSGSFRTENFEELFSEGLTQPKPVDLQPTNNDQSNYIEARQKNEPAYHFTVPEAELASIDADYSYSYWYRWNFFYPERSNLGIVRSNYQSLSFLTETGNIGGAVGDRTLAIWFGPQNTNNVYNHVSTYDIDPFDGNLWRNVNHPTIFEQDSHWNFVYFGFSREKAQAFYYQYFSRSKQSVYQRWEKIQHQYPKPAFHFFLGHSAYPTINGHYYSPQFWYTGISFLGSVDECDSLRSEKLFKPVLLQTPNLGTHQLVGSEITTNQSPNTEKRNIWISKEPAGAEEYAIYGWFKWNQIGMETWPNLFRVSMVGKEDGTDLGNVDKIGDRTFCVWSNPNGNLYPATYSSGLAGGDNWNWYVAKPYQDDLQSWFWVYFGHSNQARKGFFYVKWGDREDSQVFEGGFQKLPYYIMVTVGGEGVWHSGWNGNIKNVNFRWGPGAFKENGFELMMELPLAFDPNENEIEIDNFWTDENPVYVLSPENFKSDELQEILVPQAQLEDIKEYSFSLWFRMSYEDPIGADKGRRKGSYTAIAGVTELNSWDDLSQFGGRALSVYLTPENAGKAFWVSTYATSRGNKDDWKKLLFPNAIDYDSTWNFIYFGYSYNQEKAIFYTKFGRSQETLYQEWDKTVHNSPPQKLLFQLGSPRPCGFPSLNGRYYDVRFRTDNLAFKGSQRNIEWYLTNRVFKPLSFSPQGKMKLSNGIKNRVQTDEYVEFVIPDQLNGAREYAIWGWAKWVQPSSLAGWNNLFRVTVLDPTRQNDCCGVLGSRTLNLWYNAPGRFLYFSTYNQGQPDGDNGDVVTRHDNPEVDQWFFVYMGANINTKKVIKYVKFASGAEIYKIEDNINHFVPKQFYIYMGRDKYYNGWNGELKGWQFSAGKGSFRDGEFDELANQPIRDDLDTGSGNNQRFESHHKLPKGQEGKDNSSPIHSEEIPETDIPLTQDLSAWTWFKWGFKNPSNFGNPEGANNKCFHINRIEYEANQGIEANLCFDGEGNAGVKFVETSKEPHQETVIPVPSAADLRQWNFLYLNHNQDKQKSVGAVFFPKANEIKEAIFPSKLWPTPYHHARYRVSGVHKDNLKFNGLFFDPQLSNDKELNSNNPEDFKEVMKKVTQHPEFNEADNQDKKDGEDVSVGVTENILATLDPSAILRRPTAVNPDSRLPVKHFGDLKDEKQFAIFGQAKWIGTPDITVADKQWQTVYRLVQHDHDDVEDEAQPGDRLLMLQVSRTGQLMIETYSYLGHWDRKIAEQQVNPEQLKSWFFVYHGYNKKDGKIYFFLQTKDGTEIQHLEENVSPFDSVVNNLYLGRDKVENHGDFLGEFKGFQLQKGHNSFVETPEGALALKAKTEPAEIPEDGEVEEGDFGGDEEVDGESIEEVEEVVEEHQVGLLPPEGNCPIVYTECNYKGVSYRVCDHMPEVSFVIKSLYIPEGWSIIVYDQAFYEGRDINFSESQECLEDGVQFSILLQKPGQSTKLQRQVKVQTKYLKKNRF